MNIISKGQNGFSFQSFWWPSSWQKAHWFGLKAAAADLRFPAAAAAAARALKFVHEVYAMAGWCTATEGYNEAEAEAADAIFSVKINIFICFISLFINISSIFHFITEALQSSFKREIEPLSLQVAEISLFRSEVFSVNPLKALKTHSFFTDVNMNL